MKANLKFKLLQHLNQNKKEEGFTLIELLVVVIIIGVLAAVALPNLLSQVGKARETEIKNAVGSVNRTQQAYHFEKQAFAPSLTYLGVNIPSNYITDTTLGIANAASYATVTPANTDSINDGTRAYSGSIAYSGGVYSQVMCQSDSVIDSITANTDGSSCPAASTIIK